MTKQILLSLPKELQKQVLADAFKENFSVFFAFAKILLDAPISEGGMSTEEIEEIRRTSFQEKLDNTHI